MRNLQKIHPRKDRRIKQKRYLHVAMSQRGVPQCDTKNQPTTLAAIAIARSECLKRYLLWNGKILSERVCEKEQATHMQRKGVEDDEDNEAYGVLCVVYRASRERARSERHRLQRSKGQTTFGETRRSTNLPRVHVVLFLRTNVSSVQDAVESLGVT